MESMAADEDFEPNQDSSFSEDELVPPRSHSVSERSSTPGQYTYTHRPHTHTQCLCLHTEVIMCVLITRVVVCSSGAVCVG